MQNGDRPYPGNGRSRKKTIDGNDAYLYALRVAYLAYLLQPRQKRTKTIQKTITRAGTSTSIHDVMKDFTATKDAKSEKYPHGFVKILEKKLQAIIKSEDKRPEYQDPNVKRSFAIFLNTLTEPSFRKQAEESKRAEDLVLMFFSKATQELGRGKPPHDDGVKRMVDRHLALFVRLMSAILKEKGWADERKDLAKRLSDLERKLLKHEEDLSTPTTETTHDTVTEEVPLSYEVKDMPMVQTVGRIFGLRPAMLQSDIDRHKSEWTEEAALRDLKTYQAHLNMGTRRTLNEIDFDTKEAFDEWKKAEAPEISQMVLTIMQIDPNLAKVSAATNVPQFKSQRTSTIADDQYGELSKVLSPGSASYTTDMPDLNGLQIDDSSTPDDGQEAIYTFIPGDVRGTFRYITNMTLASDLNDPSAASPHVISKLSTDFLNELASRWRLPKVSRMILYLDCIREKFADKSLNLEQLDAAFNYAKSPVHEEGKSKRSSLVAVSVLQDRFKWTKADFSTMQDILSGIHDTLLHELYTAMMTCFDNKQSPLLGMILAVIDEHIKSDQGFSQSDDDANYFIQQVSEGLDHKARETYSELVEKEIPGEQETWEFYHITQLNKRVMEKLQKIQKRYRKNPEILGIRPLTILMECMLPAFAEDSKAMIDSVNETAKAKELEIPIQDGFDLYKELSNFRGVYSEAVKEKPFPFSVEELLQEFVWRWINTTDSQIMGWVEEAIKQDNFQVRNEDKSRASTEDERHSNSILDIFRSFNQVIEQISQLEWDDDVTYAKFMTALAKSLGNGISRYCEVLDQMFHREMDRLTPEQEAALSQTTQQKYLQYARDAWNNETKIEPFQFYPESFVKLNDVSFGILQWDKLDKEMNVDACGELLKQKAPVSAQSKRKATNYVFTIKIAEAEGLKALDVNGFSDPYVVLADEYQKRLFKTKVIYRNLDPRWDESVDITTQGPLNLIATVWDWDSMKDHDYVGRTTLKLDPSHFSDFLPREYWLNLDTQGRVLMRVSMEGERDDIQFYFGKAFRALQRAQRDMTRTITDKLSTSINQCLSIKTLRSLTTRPGSVAKVSSFISAYRNRNAPAQPAPAGPSEGEIMNALKPLFNYFDDNFFIMNQTLTSHAMIAVMTRLWKEVLVTIESLLVPALSDLPSQQKQLSQQELDIVFKWLQSLFEFFNAVDEETGEANGVPTNVLKSPKYHEIQTLNFFYFDTTENLIRTSERMASATAQSQQAQRSRLSAPPTTGGNGLLAPAAGLDVRRAKSIMMARNLGTMRKAKEEKWKAAQAEPSDDMILRILRMRPEAAGYLRDRSRQKERLAAAAAAEMIVRQSLKTGGGRMTGPSVIRR